MFIPVTRTYAEYEELITAAVRECRRLSAEGAPWADRRAALNRMNALKDECEDAYGRNPDGWE